MEKFLKKDLVIIKEDNEDFENSTKCSFLIMLMLMVMLKYEIIVKLQENYRDSGHFIGDLTK